jgi:hypothetical protein
MSLITSTKQLVLFQADSISFASALVGLPVQKIYRLLGNGNWVSYQVAAPSFASFTTFERNNFYFLVSGSSGFELPGASTEAALANAAAIVAPTLSAADVNTGNLRLAVPSGTTIDEVKLTVTPAT